MGWRDAIDTRVLNVDETLFDEIERDLKPPESIVMVAVPRRFAGYLDEWVDMTYAMAITQQRLLIARRKGLLRGVQFKTWTCEDFGRYGVGLWRGSGPGHEVRLDHETEGRIVFVFHTPNEAELVANRIAFDR